MCFRMACIWFSNVIFRIRQKTDPKWLQSVEPMADWERSQQLGNSIRIRTVESSNPESARNQSRVDGKVRDATVCGEVRRVREVRAKSPGGSAPR